MKISTKGRYGLRAMVDLAINSVTDHVALKNIAERQNISENYLEQVFSMLKKSDMVKSIKGSQGGYTLGDKPSNITIGSLLRVLEGSLTVTDTKTETAGGDIGLENCIKKNVWDKIDESINSVVDNITLEDLVIEYKKSQKNGEVMYFI